MSYPGSSGYENNYAGFVFKRIPLSLSFEYSGNKSNISSSLWCACWLGLFAPGFFPSLLYHNGYFANIYDRLYVLVVNEQSSHYHGGKEIVPSYACESC